ncbi:hypothetical protein [Marinomonas transparens]|uniref:Uncharacterized protein n=1 Tax=Marinomonas transparens TaxID=2795388 RepID=A0A934JPX5_9GAMM|nr:hypothetical protein [Marinomonas transparens]MBJ7536061.1 hypothetical protein [Marinomonas transparens]
MQMNSSLFLLILGNSFLYMDAILALILAISSDSFLVLLFNVPIVVSLYWLLRLVSKRLSSL